MPFQHEHSTSPTPTIPIPTPPLLKNLHPHIQRLKLLLLRRRHRRPKHHLRFQTPRLRNAELGLKTLVDRRVIVLEIAAHAFGFESGPDDVLHHAIALFGPFKMR